MIGNGEQQKVLRIRADLVIEDVQLPFGRVQSAEADAELSLFGKEERAPGSRHLQNRPIRRAVNRLCLHDHPGSSSVWIIIHLAVALQRIITDVHCLK